MHSQQEWQVASLSIVPDIVPDDEVWKLPGI